MIRCRLIRNCRCRRDVVLMSMADRAVMIAQIAAILETLRNEERNAPLEQQEFSEGDASMFVLSVIRTLADRGTAPGRKPVRSPDDVGAMTVQLMLHGLSMQAS